MGKIRAIRDNFKSFVSSLDLDDIILDVTGVALVSSVVLYGALITYSKIEASKINPPIYRDVNGDEVDDKIIQRRVETPGFPGTTCSTLEDEVLFGIEINGKKLYLPREQFEEYHQ